MFYFLVGKIFWKVKLRWGARTFLRMGRLWYQWVLVQWFIISRLPWASCSLTASTVCRGLFPRESLCWKRKALQASKETDAMGLPGASSLSSSLCSRMWSQPSLYLLMSTKLKVCPVTRKMRSRTRSRTGIQGFGVSVRPEKVYVSPASL